MQDYKKPMIIGASIAGLAIIGLFVKNYLQQSQFKPLKKQVFLKIYKQFRKQNYSALKQIALVASQIATQFKQITPQMIRGYLEGPESPIKVEQMFQKSVKKVTEKNSISPEEFQYNMNHFKQDQDLKKLVDQSQREFQTALQGRIPNFPVNIPESLTKEKILEVQGKIVRQKYLFQIGVFRKLRQYTKQQLSQNPDLMKQIAPESQQQMLQEQNIGDEEQPASAVLHAAILKFKTDDSFRQSLSSIENSFKNIYSRYESKINNNKITEAELTELEDEIIYFQHI